MRVHKHTQSLKTMPSLFAAQKPLKNISVIIASIILIINFHLINSEEVK